MRVHLVSSHFFQKNQGAAAAVSIFFEKKTLTELMARRSFSDSLVFAILTALLLFTLSQVVFPDTAVSPLGLGSVDITNFTVFRGEGTSTVTTITECPASELALSI
jgi:hypothetical protein